MLSYYKVVLRFNKAFADYNEDIIKSQDCRYVLQLIYNSLIEARQFGFTCTVETFNSTDCTLLIEKGMEKLNTSITGGVKRLCTRLESSLYSELGIHIEITPKAKIVDVTDKYASLYDFIPIVPAVINSSNADIPMLYCNARIDLGKEFSNYLSASIVDEDKTKSMQNLLLLRKAFITALDKHGAVDGIIDNIILDNSGEKTRVYCDILLEVDTKVSDIKPYYCINTICKYMNDYLSNKLPFITDIKQSTTPVYREKCSIRDKIRTSLIVPVTNEVITSEGLLLTSNENNMYSDADEYSYCSASIEFNDKLSKYLGNTKDTSYLAYKFFKAFKFALILNLDIDTNCAVTVINCSGCSIVFSRLLKYKQYYCNEDIIKGLCEKINSYLHSVLDTKMNFKLGLLTEGNPDICRQILLSYPTVPYTIKSYNEGLLELPNKKVNIKLPSNYNNTNNSDGSIKDNYSVNIDTQLYKILENHVKDRPYLSSTEDYINFILKQHIDNNNLNS